MRKKLPNPFRYYLKRALMVAAVPYFIYSNYKIYEAYTVVQQRKIDKKNKIESELIWVKMVGNLLKKHRYPNIHTMTCAYSLGQTSILYPKKRIQQQRMKKRAEQAASQPLAVQQLEKAVQQQKILESELVSLKKEARVYQQQQNSNVFFQSKKEDILRECQETLKSLCKEYSSLEKTETEKTTDDTQ